ncbi:MAG: PD40 domain-containing protein [Acidobacteria bacterium]|nr:PD40 domain-containing protein [Acidobacteriota bacterium]
MKKLLLTLTLTLLASTTVWPQTGKLLLRNPTMNKTQIVFVYAGDLWIVNRDGGEASRLTTGVGAEFDPLFSPDGTKVAFTGQYDGNVDVYLIPATGGVPQRLTYHPDADRVAGWTPDGKSVLFVSGRTSVSRRYEKLFTLALDGGLPQEVPLPMAHAGAYSPDGSRLAYEPIQRAFAMWKRYRGGMATPIWIANLSDSSVERIPRTDSNDFNAMWPAGENAGKVYFLSDRNGPVTLFNYDLKTKRVALALPNSGLDIKSAALGTGNDAIVYEQFGALNIFDLKSNKSKPVNITLNGDLPGVRAKYEKVAPRIANAALSPTGARAVFEARGEILTVPAEKGDARNLTNAPASAERDPAWSPDGKWIAYFSDESGEYELHLRDQKGGGGVGDIKKIKLEPTFYYSPRWSPDSKKIAFTDKRLNLWYVDIEKGQPVKVDQSLSDAGNIDPDWSPDSKWIAYTKMIKSWTHTVFVYALDDQKISQVTDGMSDALSARFDKSGKYLYFTASTDIGPTNGGLDMSGSQIRSTRSIYAAVLKKTDPSPLAPESDEEKVADEKKDEPKPAEKKDDAKPADKPAEGEKKADVAANGAAKPGAKKEPDPVKIDFDGIGQRIIALPIPARNYADLAVGKANTLFVVEMPTGPPAPGQPFGMTVHKFDLEKRKLDKFLDAAQGFIVSANGEKVLYRQGQSMFITAAAAPPKPGDGRIKLEDMEVHVDPQAEWNQMYKEVARIERDFFYDPNLHGMDLAATVKKYEPYLSGLGHRNDLNYLFQEMYGEMSVGHLRVQAPGDIPNPSFVPGGLLGADYKLENGRYRIAKVYNGENWNPQLRAPLTQPGINVVAGEYLLAVKGRNLIATDNIYQWFEGTSGKQVVIKVGPNPDGTGARDVTVVHVGSEGALRNYDWIEANRRKVTDLSGGKLAYVYLPDTAQGGFTNFNRYYFAQLDKEGAVIDERFNSGGSAADYIVDHLAKPVMSYWAVREGMEATTPFGVMPGPKVMLANEYSGSGGDLLPWMFKRKKIGPVIGKRTWGGLVGVGGYPTLVDGGYVTAPHFGFYTPEGQWEVENHGTEPDVDIDLDPAAWRKGVDVQLEKAVQLALEALKKNPVKRPVHPAFPNYHKQALPAAGNGSGN